jgi:hypothetical protein
VDEHFTFIAVYCGLLIFFDIIRTEITEKIDILITINSFFYNSFWSERGSRVGVQQGSSQEGLDPLQKI